jgi:hypothetical protein
MQYNLQIEPLELLSFRTLFLSTQRTWIRIILLWQSDFRVVLYF